MAVRKFSQPCRRYAQDVSKTAREGAHAVVSDFVADIDYLLVRLRQEALCGIEPQRVEELKRRHAGDLAEGAIEMIRACGADPGHLLQGHWLVDLASDHRNDGRNRLVVGSQA